MEGVVMLTAGPEGRKTGVAVRVAKTTVFVGQGVGVGSGVRVGGTAGVLVAFGVGIAAVATRVGSSSAGWQPTIKSPTMIRNRIVFFLSIYFRRIRAFFCLLETHPLSNH
jgi:hypothetical protein